MIVDELGNPRTSAGGGFIPSIISSFVNKECLNKGRLFWNDTEVIKKKYKYNNLLLEILLNMVVDLHLITARAYCKIVQVQQWNLLNPVLEFEHFFPRILVLLSKVRSNFLKISDTFLWYFPVKVNKIIKLLNKSMFLLKNKMYICFSIKDKYQ